MENINLSQKQQEMEEIIRKCLESPFYTSDENCLLYHLAPKFHSCDYEKRELTLVYNVKPWQANPQQGCHGGISASMVDSAMGILTHYYSPENFISTISLTVNYLRPIPIGEDVLVRVWANSWGRTIVSLSAEIYVPSKDVVAITSVGTYIVLRGKPTQIPIKTENKGE